MPATFHIPGPLRQFVAGRDTVEIADAPATLADALSALWLLHPALRDRISTEQGHIREHINIFIAEEDARYTGGLLTPLPPSAEIWIVPNISGGS
ncbi:MAG: MoaD/ThiS family protein [Candidatus Acidiferrales bacterium]